jgi:DNA-binding Lrp family transcriptional regulator
VLIHCATGSEFEVEKKLALIPEVLETKVTYGVFDVLCKVEAPSIESLKDIIINDIRSNPKILDTQTLLLFNKFA